MSRHIRRRSLLAVLPAAASLPAWSQPPGMRPVPAGERRAVHVGAGTQDGVTTGSSGPSEGSQEGAAAGTLGSTQPGGGSGSGGGAGGRTR